MKKKRKLLEEADRAVLLRSFLDSYDGKTADAGTEGRILKNSQFEEDIKSRHYPARMKPAPFKFYPDGWNDAWIYVNEEDFEII